MRSNLIKSLLSVTAAIAGTVLVFQVRWYFQRDEINILIFIISILMTVAPIVIYKTCMKNNDE